MVQGHKYIKTEEEKKNKGQWSHFPPDLRNGAQHFYNTLVANEEGVPSLVFFFLMSSPFLIPGNVSILLLSQIKEVKAVCLYSATT